MTTNTERQRTFHANMTAKGFVRVHGYVHAHQLADIQLAIAALRADADLEIGVLKHAPSGKLRSLSRKHLAALINPSAKAESL